MVSLRPSGRVPSVVGSAGSRPHLPRVSPGPDAADTLRKHAATHGDLQAVEADGGSQTTTNHAFSVTDVPGRRYAYHSYAGPDPAGVSGTWSLELIEMPFVPPAKL